LIASGPKPDAGYDRAMPCSLVIFDLDGTLADSLPWFRRNVNDIADLFSFSRIADEDVQSLRQAGSR
jgi:phosphoglycolate phosphatase